MVTYIKSDLEFILKQIELSEAHAGGQNLYGPGGLIPTYNLAWGLRTVDGTYNNLLNPTWGSADQPFLEGLGTDYRTLFLDADPRPDVINMQPMTYTPGVDNDGPTTTLPSGVIVGNRAGPGDVIDPEVRIISNLIVDQTLGNPSAILTALERAGVSDPTMAITSTIADAYAPVRPLFDALSAAERAYANASAAAAASPNNAALQTAAANAQAVVDAAKASLDGNSGYVALTALLATNGIALDGINIVITNAAPDEGLSAPFNSWFTLFGQFFDHGLDLVGKGGSGTVMIPLMPDDPLYVVGSPTNFMVLTRATVGAGLDGIMVDNPATTIDESADNVRPINTTTPFVDQNQTYSSHASHQVFLREYVLNAAGDPVSTGELIQGAQGGMATWKDLKAQAADLLGIQLLNSDVGNVPLLLTDPYGEFIRGPNGFVQIMTTTGLVEANPADNGGLGTLLPANTLRTGHAFLADIAHSAVPDGLADGDIEIGLDNPGNTPGVYDNELLDAHYVAGDGRANENVGLTAVHHVFHSEHNRLAEHTKVTVLETKDLAFINQWLLVDLDQAQLALLPATLPTDPALLDAFLNTFTWDGERIFQAAKFGTEMQYQHLVFEEFARKIQPNINVFLVPDGYDVTIDPTIVAEFAHVVYRFGHSMLTETIDRFDPQYNADHIGLIEGFLNPIQFENNGGTTGVDADISAGAIIRGMTRQAGNEIDEFVTSALRNNLLGLPLDLATINLARGRDTGVPTLNETRAQFYAATDGNSLLKPYESWVDFAGHLKHEASIINFIAAYGTHETILAATTVEGKRDAAMALVGFNTGTSNTAVSILNSSFETDSLANGAPNVITDVLGNYTLTAPTGWTMTGLGGVFTPAATVTNPAGLTGTNVAWLSQDALLAKDTGVVLEAGARYSLTFDMADRLDTAWPGGVARLVAGNGDVLASQVLAAPADGNWSTVTFQTGVIAANAGQGLRIEIQQTGGTSNQILIDDVQLNIVRTVASTLNEEDRQAFLNGTGQYAASLGGLNNVDLWIGGLAEQIMPFGGMLGSTFNFVFETQMESLQSGDRFYYLQRLDGLHLFGEMEGNSFAAMIMRNTDATHLPSDVFSTPGLILEVDRTKQYNPGLGEDAGLDGILVDDPLIAGDQSADNLGRDPIGSTILTPIVIRNDPTTAGPDTNYLRYTGGEHVLLGGTDAADTLIGSVGDDTLFGDAGNDKLEGGFGNDIINGGDGDDIIRDAGGDDNIKGGKGNDAIHAGPGLDLVLAGDGQDFVILGTDMGSEVFGGLGNDFILGNKNAERLLGNEGDDWLETGTFDGAPGDNFDEIFASDSIRGNDVFLGDGGFDEFIGEGGDDIFVGSPGRGKMAGMSGFDWATYKDNAQGVNADLSIPIVFDEAPSLPQNSALDEFESVQGLSGTRFSDILSGSNEDASTLAPLAQGGSTGTLGSGLDAQGIALINGLQAVLGAGVTSFAAGDIILGGDGSDIIQGNGGDDIIDGDKWLDVQIGVYAPGDTAHTGPTIKIVNSMKDLTADVFAGLINPGQLAIVRTIKTDTTAGDIDTAAFRGARGEYAFSATADGQVVVSHAIEDAIDGTDRLRNIERITFADNNPLNIIVGTPGNDALNGTAQDDLILGLAGADVLNGGAGNDILVGGADGTTTNTATSNYADNFNDNSFGNSTGNSNWGPDWVEDGDLGVTTGQIRIDDGSSTLRIIGGNGADGATITRAVPLTTAASATIAFSADPASLEANESVVAQFTADVSNPNGVVWVTMATITGNGANAPYTYSATGPFPNASIRFVATAMNEVNDVVNIDNLVVTFTTSTSTSVGDTLNGGLGNDTYSFVLGDGNDVINEAVSATSGGTADRISILAPSTGVDVDGLPILTISALNAHDSNTATQTGDLVINYTLPTGTQQTITVAGHFNGTNAETGVERINFNGANFNGHALGSDDYLISRLDPNNRDTAGVNLSASIANNFIVGELGVNDVITGGSGSDLIFGATGNNNLVGGLGDDLLVGGAGNDVLDARLNAVPDDFLGAFGADTLVGGAGNDTYGVDDIADVVVELANEGVDTVETFLTTLSLAAMANVENLSYEGADAGQFVGTGNALNNTISGGDLVDTLSGLVGNDTLNGGLGADTMIGGEGNDTYVVDDVGDVVNETTGLPADVDTVQSSVSYTLATGVENLTLTGADAINGTGNAAVNVIVGNNAANQLFGGAGNDTLTGNAGADLLDGGTGDDALNGGDDNDTIIGGAGNDTIDVGGGVNTVVYNATGFGNDVINSFDSNGGTPANQDRIDLSGLGVTAANFGARVFEATAGVDTIITIRENGLASAIQGTIRINGSNTGAIDQSDFTLAVAAPVLAGATANNDTLNGTAGANTINGGAGADIINGGDGNDILSGGTGITAGTYADTFTTAAYNNNTGTLPFASNWTETGDNNNNAAAGDILVTGGVLRFASTIDANDNIARTINLAGATAPTLSFTYQGAAAGETIVVEALNGGTWQSLGSIVGTASGNFSAPLDPAHSAIRLRTTSAFDANETFSVDNVSVALGPNSGVDTINGDAGDDTIIWNANAAAPTDGRDLVNGGTEGAAGDTFSIVGNASTETYRIYTRAAFLAAPGNAAVTLAAESEIVITRNGTGAAAIIAELNEIEEIRLNGADPSGAGTTGGDAFEVIGDFASTSLRLNTITIDGDAGDDTIDISALSSAHRIVFRSNGGQDTILGTLRPEDVIELGEGTDPASYISTIVDGVTTLSNGENSVTYRATGAGPQIGGDDNETVEDEEVPDTNEGEEDPDDEVDQGDEDDVALTNPAHVLGTAQDDVLLGTSAGNLVFGYAGTDYIVAGAGADVINAGLGNDFVDGEAGRDIIFGDDGNDDLFGGDDDDLIYGDAGNDRLFGQDGNDLIDAGVGNDTIFGGNGNDMFLASAGDGNDTYYGGEISGDAGIDTLDMGFLTADAAVNLGTGVNGRGSAVSSESGTDALYGIENVVTGSGNDRIVMSNAVNIVDGGSGEDVFVFGSSAAANGDTILSFEAGDKIDLSGIDANGATAGNGTFTLESGQSATAPGQIVITHETREDGEYTVVSGNTAGDTAPEFRVNIAGHHVLTGSDFNL